MRVYVWEGDALYLHCDTEPRWVETDLAHAAAELPGPALACLSAKYASRVHVPRAGSLLSMGASSDELAEKCAQTMVGYRVRHAIKWHPDQPGGWLLFEKAAADHGGA